MSFFNHFGLFALISSNSCFGAPGRLLNACGLKINAKLINQISAQLMPHYVIGSTVA